MRKALVLLFVCCLLIPSAQAAAPMHLNQQGIVGGFSVNLHNITAPVSAGGDSTNAPQVVEVYTASWCENCVPAEHALMDAIEGEDVTLLAHHRAIGEVEDPLGSEAGDQRWIDLYGRYSELSVGLARAPPTMIFEGNWMKAGSAPEGDSLEADYTALLQEDPGANAVWSSSFDFVGTNASGVVNWTFTWDEVVDYEWTHVLMAVEHTAHFPEGSNELEDYEHVVREVYTLSGDSGSMQIDLPETWDGDDLSLVLVHQYFVSAEEETSVNPGDDGWLLGFLAPSACLALLGAAACSRP